MNSRLKGFILRNSSNKAWALGTQIMKKSSNIYMTSTLMMNLLFWKKSMMEDFG